MFRRLLNARNTRPGARLAVVRAIAGLPVAMRQTRRGSFLIMVVGTLALLAIITIVYVSIGRSDRQTSMAALKHDDRRDTPDQLGAYLRSVIAEDLFDHQFLGERNANGDPIFRREASDYPSTPYGITVPDGTGELYGAVTIGDPSAADARFYFTPTGNGTGTDPWLASSEPCLLDFDGSALAGGPGEYFLERLDWLNISNFAPDGSFVNLANLKGKYNGQTKRFPGRFDATPWEMRGYPQDKKSAKAKLTLFETDPSVGPSVRSGDLDYGDDAWLPRYTDAKAVPAHWSGRQRWLVHPGADPAYAPGEPEYMLYQYADADGDGILDSRWFELVEDRDPTDNIEHWLIERDDDMRYFFAVRAIDLSGRINVNTATDSTLAPLAADPLGVLPGGVDIRRFLTLEDFYTDLRTGFAYDGYIQPTFPGLNDPNDPDPANYAGYTQDNAYAAGEKAYDALRMVLDTGLMPGRGVAGLGGYAGLEYLAGGASIDREFSLDTGGDPLNLYWATYWKTGGAFGPSEYYSQFAGFGSGGGAGYTTGGNLDSGLGRSFTADSLLELLTRNGVNDNRTNSPLEVALSGRGDPAVMGPLDAGRFGPLRDNRRTDSIERLRGGWALGPFQFYDQAKAALYTDIRQRLTTLGGGRPLVPSIVSGIFDSDIGGFVADPAQLPLTKSDTKDPIEKLFPANATGQDLFELYAAALSPYSDIQQHWDPTAPDFAKTLTLYYGNRGPYLALQTAGFLAVNMLDAYDEADIHTKRTLLFNGSDAFRSANNLGANYTGDRTPEYPWKLLDLDPDAPNTQYPKLWAGTNIADMPEAINVFGIEAQPFITEAASFVMYTDTPDALGGDDDSGEMQLNGERFWRLVPSINGEVPSTTKPENPDFLFELLAFQVHNPFDESITLSGEASGDIAQARRDLYYIQYGGLYIKFTNVESGTEQEITLGARETKTLYVLTQHPDAIAKRINTITQDAAYGGKTLDEEKARIRAWINRQLGPNAVLVAPFNPVTGMAEIPDPNVADLRDVEDLQKGSVAERRIVRLWRVEKPEEENVDIQVAGLDETTNNVIENDTLIDRLREPNTAEATPILDRLLWEPGDRPQDKNREVNDAVKGPEPPDGDATDKDNRGLSITRFSVVRRNGDTNAGSVSTVPRGGFPAYCIEVKDQSGAAANEADDDGSAQKSLDINDFNGKVGDDTLNGLMGKQGNSGDLSNRLVPTISTDPEQKYDDPKFGLDIKQIPSNLAGIPFEGGLDSFGNLQAPLYVEPSLNNDKFEVNGISTMRVADLLLPLGIAPHQIPLLNGLPPAEDIQWTTLSEALAIALAYDQPVAPSIYANMFYDAAPTFEPLLDRAGVRYDAFVPFRDLDGDGAYTAGEPRWGLGIPAAANIFDAITTLPPKFGSIDAVTHGQININTASRETLRALPGLSPPNTTNPDGTPNWWWTDLTHDWRSDIATTVAAYRDRLALFTRDVDDDGGVAEPNDPINFRNWWANPFDPMGDNPLPTDGDAPGSTDAEFAGDNGRWGATGVMGIREALGFRSLGELAFMRDWSYSPDTDPNYLYPHDIDRLGYDQSNLDAEGVDSGAYDYDGDGNKTDDDEIDDDFSERLALANAVMASSSVRSDVFAVWFIVHGYRESDVKGLGVNDPMVPSVARRFVMVVDRSNVTKPGDEPRIVLFKEVPL